jgi:hypothetical protein
MVRFSPVHHVGHYGTADKKLNALKIKALGR